MRCDWASCSKDATIWCGQWWHCTGHYRLHCEFEVEKQRQAVGDARYFPTQRGAAPKRERDRAAYRREWMARKRAAQRAEKASA